MALPEEAYQHRPVQVQWLKTSVLIEYMPAYTVLPGAKAAQRRAVTARNDQQRRTGIIDFAAEVLTGWSHKDKAGNATKPTREALRRMPDGWLQALAISIGQDMEDFGKEHGD